MTILSRCRVSLYAFAVAFGFAGLAAPDAHAFTIDNQSGTNPDGSAKYVDPDARRFGGTTTSDGKTTIRQGNTTLQFGTQRPFGERYYNNERMFNPNGRPENER